MTASDALSQALFALNQARRELREALSSDAGIQHHSQALTAALDQPATTPAWVAEMAAALAASKAPPIALIVRAAAFPSEQVRAPLSDILVELAHARFKEFAEHTHALLDEAQASVTATCMALDALTAVMEEGAAGILCQALGHASPEVVATAIGGLVAVDAYECAEAIAPLCEDTRRFTSPLGGVEEELHISELATEALAYLSE